MRWLLIGTSITAAIAAVMLFVLLPRTETDTTRAGSDAVPASGNAQQHLSTPADSAPVNPMESDGDENALNAVRKWTQQAQNEQGNLQKFFGDLRQLCRNRELDHQACTKLLEKALADHPDSDFAALLKRIMGKLPAYRDTMESTVMSGDRSSRERYEKLRKQRRELLGTEETRALYAQEQALAEYRFAYGELKERAEQMSPEQRLQRLEELRSEHFDEYKEELSEIEGDHGAYRHERELLLAGVEDPGKRERITAELRERHFDDETIQRMEERDAQREQQNRRIQRFREAEAELEKQLAQERKNMPEDQWRERYQQEMERLRREFFSDSP